MAILDNVKAFWRLGDAYNAPLLVDASGRGNDLTPYLRINPCTVTFRMGRNSSVATPGQQAFAALKGWGRWERIWTSGEKAAAAAGEYWPFSTTTTLQDAKAYYLLDELGGATTYADATGRGNALTATGTTVRVNGPLGAGDHATRLDAGVYLTRTSPGTDLQNRQVSCTVAGWVNLTSKPTTPTNFAQQVFWGQVVNETPSMGFNVYFEPVANRFWLDFHGGDGEQLPKGSLVKDNVTGSPTIGVWYFLIAEFDLENNLTAISANNATRTTLSPILQPVPAAGKIGNASQFQVNPTGSFAASTSGWDIGVPGTPEGNCYADHAQNADLAFGNNSKTVWGWFKTTAPTVYQHLAGIFDNANEWDWILQISGNVLYFVFGDGPSSYTNVPMADTNWHLVVAWYNTATNKIHIDLDHGAQAANVTPAAPQTQAFNFRLGSNIDLTENGSAHQFQGLLNAWGIADGVPDQADLDALWNNGDGWTWPEESSAVFTAMADYVVRIPADDYVVQIPADDGTVIL